MLKTETLDELFGARDSIADQMIALTPRNENERALLDELIKQYRRLTAKIQEVIAAPFSKERGEPDKSLEEAVKSLEGTAKQLKALRKSMDDVQLAIETADRVVRLASSIIALAA